ncbi:TPA: hypothetical protein ACNICG_002816 [Acinetobacter baumannii]
MTDLNKKQAFWAEQLPLFKEKYWLPEHLDVLEFNMDGGCFEIPVDVKTDLSEDDLFDIYHRVNSGWAMWKKAVTFMQEKAKAQAVPEGWVIVPQELPLDMALKIAKERILEQPPVKDPVLNEILEKAHKENIQSEQCRLMRDYKEMVKRLSESGAEG